MPSFNFFEKNLTTHVEKEVMRKIQAYNKKHNILFPHEEQLLIQQLLAAEKNSLAYKLLEYQDEVGTVLDTIIPKAATFNVKPSKLINFASQALSKLISTVNEDEGKSDAEFAENVKFFIYNQVAESRRSVLSFVKKIDNKEDKKVLLQLIQNFHDINSAFENKELNIQTLNEAVNQVRTDCFAALKEARSKLSSKNKTLLDPIILALHKMFYAITGYATQRIVSEKLAAQFGTIERFAVANPPKA